MKVLIVTGFDKSLCTFSDAVSFFDYLIKEVGITKDRICFYGRAEFEAKIDFYNLFARICIETLNEPLVIYYSGHGSQTGWDFKRNVEIAYELLTHFLHPRNAPLIFINDCCFGMSAADFLKDLHCRKLIIGLAPKDLAGQSEEEVGSVLLPDLFSRWRKHACAHPKFKVKKKDLPEEMREAVNLKVLRNCSLRYGDGIDYLLFPQRNTAHYLYRISQILLKIMQLATELALIFWRILKPS